MQDSSSHTRGRANCACRKFWREMLPRIKYRNPSIPIQISRHTSPDGPALMHIYTQAEPNTPDGSSNTSVPSLHTHSGTAATPPSGTPNARNTLVPDATAPSHTINIRDQAPSEILDALLAKLPDSQVIRPTAEEEQQMADMVEFKERSEADRVLVREKLLKERREAELLRLARGETVAS
jgi:large subunit ribosomal protein MRP49